MFLKKIVISGFKSFADKIVINLDRGISGVVGPNGSGKSNIIDAVRWVMGEQNAKNLRGEKATDIIFSGSERRKALNMAEVSLIFDNTEESAFCPPEYRHESEIILTRRLYADGQRDYLINRKNCRLKDIVGFFTATGLGGKSYSMIQQGQVDRILNAKPEDVREILEDAAGTNIFKKRRAEAQRKLANAELNLSRIDDILVEIEDHLNRLQDQVKKAKKYNEYQIRLKEDEMSIFAHQYRKFDLQFTELKDAIEKLNLEEAEQMAKVSSLDADRHTLQTDMDEADPDLNRLREAISVLREQIATSQATLKGAQQRVDAGGRRLNELAEELEDDDANLKVLEKQVDAASAELSAAETVAREFTDAIGELTRQLENSDAALAEFTSRTEELDDEIKNLERLVETNKFRHGELERNRERNTKELAGERERLHNLEEELAASQIELTDAEKNASEKQAGLDVELKEKHSRETSMAQNYQGLTDARGNRDDLKEKYHEARARYTSLQEVQAHATDIADAYTQLKDETDIDLMVRGLLTDFIALGETADELPPKAVAMFEKWSERLLVNSLDRFNDLVRTANQLNVGPLPVTLLDEMVQVEPDKTRAWAEKWGAEPLRPFLKVERSFPELDRILDRLYLLSSLSIDNEMLAELPQGIIVFAAQGICFASHDEFTVGCSSGGGLLARKQELEVLAQDLKKYEGELATAQMGIDQLDVAISEDRQIVAEIDARLQQQNADVTQVMAALQAAQQLNDHKLELIRTTKDNLEGFENTAKGYDEAEEELKRTRVSLDEELTNAGSELESNRTESQTLIDTRDEIDRVLNDKKLDEAKSQARAQALKDSYLNSRAQLDMLQNKLNRRYEERARIESDIETAKTEIVESEHGIERFIREREQLDKEYLDKNESHKDILDQIRALDEKLINARDKQNKIGRQAADKAGHIERIEFQIENVLEQAQEKYHLDLKTYEFEFDEKFDFEKMNRGVHYVRRKIEEIGAVNMMALEEFDEKSERRDFIIKQRDEVLSSMDLLTMAIDEIEETTMRKFSEVFERVNKEFQELFPILFPGGMGRLELTDSENPLEGGVDILCQLPGKKMKAMSLFSGGEKALTAISLIFALLKTKPTPYCFLDEVDAPLDETNVGRYNRVLEALSEQFQFIVITHNRRTMEVLDTLYGITMQEPGVSKVVGVDMQKDLPGHLRKALDKEREVEGASAQ